MLLHWKAALVGHSPRKIGLDGAGQSKRREYFRCGDNWPIAATANSIGLPPFHAGRVLRRQFRDP